MRLRIRSTSTGGNPPRACWTRRRILEGLAITPGQVILDAGCGNGYMAKAFAERTGESGNVYALDPDADSIEVLKGETRGSNIEALVGDITRETPLKPSSLDLVYLSTVIHGFSETELDGAIREIERLLKPGGKLAIVEIRKEDTPFGPPMAIRFSPEELRSRIDMRPAGLTDAGEHFYMQVFEKPDDRNL